MDQVAHWISSQQGRKAGPAEVECQHTHPNILVAPLRTFLRMSSHQRSRVLLTPSSHSSLSFSISPLSLLSHLCSLDLISHVFHGASLVFSFFPRWITAALRREMGGFEGHATFTYADSKVNSLERGKGMERKQMGIHCEKIKGVAPFGKTHAMFQTLEGSAQHISNLFKTRLALIVAATILEERNLGRQIPVPFFPSVWSKWHGQCQVHVWAWPLFVPRTWTAARPPKSLL